MNPNLVYFAQKPPRLKPLQQQRDGLMTVSCQDPQLFKLDGLQPVSYDREYTPWLSFLLSLLVLDLCVVVVLSERHWSYLLHSLVTPRWQMLSPRCFVRMRLLEWIKITASSPRRDISRPLSSSLTLLIQHTRVWVYVCPVVAKRHPPKIWCKWYPWCFLYGETQQELEGTNISF